MQCFPSTVFFTAITPLYLDFNYEAAIFRIPIRTSERRKRSFVEALQRGR